MAELMIVLAYALLLGIPLLIIGFGAMVNENKAVKALAMINFLSILSYFNFTGTIPGWVSGLFIVMITMMFIFMFRSVLSSA